MSLSLPLRLSRSLWRPACRACVPRRSAHFAGSGSGIPEVVLRMREEQQEDLATGLAEEHSSPLPPAGNGPLAGHVPPGATPLSQWKAQITALRDDPAGDEKVVAVLEQMADQGVQPDLELYKLTMDHYRHTYNTTRRDQVERDLLQRQKDFDELTEQLVKADEKDAMRMRHDYPHPEA